MIKCKEGICKYSAYLPKPVVYLVIQLAHGAGVKKIGKPSFR